MVLKDYAVVVTSEDCVSRFPLGSTLPDASIVEYFRRTYPTRTITVEVRQLIIQQGQWTPVEETS